MKKTAATAITPESFSTCGALLRYLRRRARLTQRDLSIAVGYSEAQISFLESDRRHPDPTTLAALFVPALGLEHEPAFVARLMELASASVPGRASPTAPAAEPEPQALEQIPALPPFHVNRPRLRARVRARLHSEKHVALYGLAGSGKTTLAACLACESRATEPVFWMTLTEAITCTADILIRQLAVFLHANGEKRVAPVLRLGGDGATVLSLDRQVALIGAALTARPFLICIHNIHLIQQDTMAMQIIQHLVATTPVRVLLTSREQVPLSGLSQIAVGGLEEEEGMALVAHLARGALSPSLAHRLLDRTGGSPMLLRLAIGQLLDEEADPEAFIGRLETRAQVANYLVEIVLKKLTPAAWDLLSLLSVLRHPADLCDGRLAEIAFGTGRVREMDGAADELQRHQLIDTPGRATESPLIRDLIYSELKSDPATRAHLHRAAAQWVDQVQQDGLEAAYHWSHAGEPEAAADALETRQVDIVARGQGLEGAAVIDELLVRVRRGARGDRDDLVRRLLAARAYLLWGTTRSNECESNLREALLLTSSPAVRAHLSYRLGWTLLVLGKYDEALQTVQSALALLSPSDQFLRASLAAVASSVYRVRVQFDQVAASASLALELTENMAGTSPELVAETRARAYYSLAEAARQRRDIPVALGHIRAALAAARHGNLRREENTFLAYIGGLLYDLGDLEGSLRYRNQALAGATAVEDHAGAAYVMVHLADIHLIQLELDAALSRLDQAREYMRYFEDMRGLASEENVRASCLILQGRTDQARLIVERLLSMTENQGTGRMWGYYVAKLATCQMVEGSLVQARATLKRALDHPATALNPMEKFELCSDLALATAAAGDAVGAQSVLAMAPYVPGLSRWAEFSRKQVEAVAAIVDGDIDQAAALVADLAVRTKDYPLHHWRTKRLADALQDPPSPAALPAFLWRMPPSQAL